MDAKGQLEQDLARANAADVDAHGRRDEGGKPRELNTA